MSTNPFESQFSIIKLDKAGAGEVLRISFQPSKSDNKDSPRPPNCICHFIVASPAFRNQNYQLQ